MTDAKKTNREAVAAYFESTVPRWEEIYTEQDKRPVYSLIYRSRLSVAISLVEGLGLPAGSRCLDVGCGPGFATVALAQRGFVVNAIDLVEAQLVRTRQRAAETHFLESVVADVGDIHHLDFPDDVFDVVFVVGVMEWLEDPNTPLREISRVLKPGGYAILSVDNKWALRNILDPRTSPLRPPIWRYVRRVLERSGMQRQSDPGPRDYSYSIRHFDRLVSDAGLEKAEGVTVGFGPFPFVDLELPPSVGLPLHRKLQHLADQGFPLLRSAGFVYLTVAKKSSTSAAS